MSILHEEKITSFLKIGRSLTEAERRYVGQWRSMELEDKLIMVAYERTCLNTGGLNWAYMNKILQRWHECGYRTIEDLLKAEAKNRYQSSNKDAEIQRLKEKNRGLLRKVAELQEALLKEKDKVNRLLHERGSGNG